MRNLLIKVGIAVVLLALAVAGIVLVLTNKTINVPAEDMYGIAMDAGSSHTSLFVYKWPAVKQNGTGIVREHWSCHVKGGISSFEGKPGGAAKSLGSCLDQALENIPESRHRQTLICLGATAGMRLLNMTNPSESQRILKEVETKIRSYPFLFKEAVILSGQDEGAFGWVTVNYLEENFIKYGLVGRWLHPGRRTVGALDLGGASTQITFETTEKVESSINKVELTLFGMPYKVYTHSFLCYGQEQFLKQLQAHLIKAQGLKAQVIHPCYLKEFNKSVTLGNIFESPCTKSLKPPGFDPDKNVTFVGTGNYQECLNIITKFFSSDKCSYSKCSFNGIYQPKVKGNFMAFSAYYFTQNYIRILTKKTVKTPNETAEAAQIICGMTISDVKQKLDDNTTRIDHVYKICAMSNFMHVILTKGYHFDEGSYSSISFKKEAGGVSVGWALGYMLNRSNSVSSVERLTVTSMSNHNWRGTLIVFIVFLIFSLLYLLVIFRTARAQNEGI